MIERTVKIKRCAAVVKGGRRFSFAAMVVCGDGKGKVGWGYGKANEVQPSVEKANKQAMRSLVKVPMVDGALPHRVDGVKNILTKSFGSNNPVTLVKATIDALQSVRTKEDVERLRGVEL